MIGWTWFRLPIRRRIKFSTRFGRERCRPTREGTLTLGPRRASFIHFMLPGSANNINPLAFVQNTSTGAGAASCFIVGQDYAGGSKNLSFFHLSTGWTTSGTNISNSGLIVSGNATTGGLVLRTDANAPLIFATNGSAK